MTVYESLGELDYAVNQLNDATSKLADAIAHVLVPEGGVTAHGGGTPIPFPSCEVAHRIVVLTEKVKEIYGRVVDLELRAAVMAKIEPPKIPAPTALVGGTLSGVGGLISRY